MHMNGLQRVIVALALAQFGFAGAALAQDAAPQTVSVTLTSYAFTPNAIDLKANVPVKLHLINGAEKGHNFSAPEFFTASAVAPADQSKIDDGAVEVDGGQSVDVTVTPGKPGTYALTCTHFMHTTFGMTGTITVH
jgi:uncharacterized cupredoxin-like copper-binding protein